MLCSVAMPVTTLALEPAVQSVSGGEVKEALADVSGLLALSDQVKTTSDSDSAVKAVIAGAVVDIPKDPSEGVTFAANNGPVLDIKLPNADDAAAAKPVAPGVVAYPAGNGSANAVQATEDGGVKMLTVIDSPTAPTAYDYDISMPSGGLVQLTAEGGAVVVGNNGQVAATVDKPWAKDANGKILATYFMTNGTTLTQFVEHNVEGVAYPVTADPWFKRWYGWDFEFNRRQTNNIMFGMGFATATAMGIPDPTISKILGAGLAGLGAYAGWVYNRGGCIKVHITYTRHFIPGHYYGGNCW